MDPENLVLKRVELIPIGLEETIQQQKSGSTTKIIWREIGFLKYYGTFKKLFHSMALDDIHPSSLRVIHDFLS